jgi:hypothetical protein
MLESVAVQTGGSWTAVADLILMKKNLGRLASLDGWFGGAKPKAVLKPPRQADSLVQNAVQVAAEAGAEEGVLQFASGSTPTAARDSGVRAVGRVHAAPIQRAKREPIRGVPYRMTPQQMIQHTAKSQRKR